MNFFVASSSKARLTSLPYRDILLNEPRQVAQFRTSEMENGSDDLEIEDGFPISSIT